MGWTFMHRERGQTTKAILQMEMGSGLIDVATVSPQVSYGAYKTDRGVIGITILTQYRKNDPYNFGYKDIDEGMGPVESKCPQRILKLLSPLEDVYVPGTHNYENYESAKCWRERCQNNLTTKPLSFNAGDTVTFKELIKFRDGSELKEFVVVSKRPLRFKDTKGLGRQYRIPRSRLADIVKIKANRYW